jgi:restriction system protein
MALWMVRSGRHGEGDDLALSAEIVGIGWPEAGDLSLMSGVDDIRERLAASYTDAKPSTIANSGSRQSRCIGV